MIRALVVLSLLTLPAQATAPYKRDAKLQRCMVYLPNLNKPKLRAWCLRQSERMP